MDTSPIDLPDEIIELILSRCPAKSVVRFKSVSKSWHSNISDPRFSRIHHIQRSKLSENQNKFFLSAWPIYCIADLNLSRLVEDGKFQMESVLDYPSEFMPLSSCDGLILLRSTSRLRSHDEEEYMLWTPFLRKHIIPAFTPKTHPEAFKIWPNNGTSPSMHLLYFDSTTEDYNIVFVYRSCYTVYSCKNGIWGEIKDIPIDDLKPGYRADHDRCIYSKGDDGEIVCFDSRDGKVSKFPQPNDVNASVEVVLGVVSGRLSLHGWSEDRRRLQLWVMEKNGSSEKSWRKLISMEKEVGDLSGLTPICLTNEDLVVLCARASKNEEDDDIKLFIYNPKKKGFQEIEFDWEFHYFIEYFPYLENLYMPTCSNIC